MPQAVAEIEKVGAVVARQRLAVLAEIGDVVQSGTEAVILLLGDVAATRILALAEIERKGHLLFVGNILIAKQEHGVFVHAGLDVAGFLRRQRLAQIDARNFAKEMRVKLPDRDRHRGFSCSIGAVVPLPFGQKATPGCCNVNAGAGMRRIPCGYVSWCSAHRSSPRAFSETAQMARSSGLPPKRLGTPAGMAGAALFLPPASRAVGKRSRRRRIVSVSNVLESAREHIPGRPADSARRARSPARRLRLARCVAKSEEVPLRRRWLA